MIFKMYFSVYRNIFCFCHIRSWPTKHGLARLTCSSAHGLAGTNDIKIMWSPPSSSSTSFRIAMMCEYSEWFQYNLLDFVFCCQWRWATASATYTMSGMYSVRDSSLCTFHVLMMSCRHRRRRRWRDMSAGGWSYTGSSGDFEPREHLCNTG